MCPCVIGLQETMNNLRGSALRLVHQLSVDSKCSEVLTTTQQPKVIDVLLQAIYIEGGAALAIEALKRMLAPTNRAKDALVMQALDLQMVSMLLMLRDWKLSTEFWSSEDAAVGRVLAVDTLRALAAPGAYGELVQGILDESEVSDRLQRLCSCGCSYCGAKKMTTREFVVAVVVVDGNGSTSVFSYCLS